MRGVDHGGADDARHPARRLARELEHRLVLAIPEVGPGRLPRRERGEAHAARDEPHAPAQPFRGARARPLEAVRGADRPVGELEDPGVASGTVGRVLPHRRLILVVQVHGAVGLADEVRVARVAPADRQRAGADDAPVLAREPAVEGQRSAVHRAHAVLHHPVVQVRRRRDLREEDHVGAVLASGLADDVLDVREVALDLAELHGELDGDDAACLGHHAATEAVVSPAPAAGIGGRSSRHLEVGPLRRPDAGRAERPRELLAPGVGVDAQLLAQLAQQRAPIRARAQCGAQRELPAAQRIQHVMGRRDAVEDAHQVRRLRAVERAQRLVEERRRLGDPGLLVAPVVARAALLVAAPLGRQAGAIDAARIAHDRRDGLAEQPAEAHRVAHPLADHRILEMPGVAGERPPRSAGAPVERRDAAGAAHLRRVRRVADALGGERVLGEHPVPHAAGAPCGTAGSPPRAP